MMPVRRVETRTYRLHRLVVIDDGRSGWQVRVYGDSASGCVAELRHPDPAGLPALLTEASRRVDQRLAGPPAP